MPATCHDPSRAPLSCRPARSRCNLSCEASFGFPVVPRAALVLHHWRQHTIGFVAAQRVIAHSARLHLAGMRVAPASSATAQQPLNPEGLRATIQRRGCPSDLVHIHTFRFTASRILWSPAPRAGVSACAPQSALNPLDLAEPDESPAVPRMQLVVNALCGIASEQCARMQLCACACACMRSAWATCAAYDHTSSMPLVALVSSRLRSGLLQTSSSLKLAY